MKISNKTNKLINFTAFATVDWILAVFLTPVIIYLGKSTVTVPELIIGMIFILTGLYAYNTLPGDLRCIYEKHIYVDGEPLKGSITPDYQKMAITDLVLFSMLTLFAGGVASDFLHMELTTAKEFSVVLAMALMVYVPLSVIAHFITRIKYRRINESF